MRTKMHNAPGYGASPEATREYDFDLFEARAMLAAMDEIRTDGANFSAVVAARLHELDLWDPSLGRHASEKKLARFRAALEELVDDFVDQNKLAEAGEIA